MSDRNDLPRRCENCEFFDEGGQGHLHAICIASGFKVLRGMRACWLFIPSEEAQIRWHERQEREEVEP